MLYFFIDKKVDLRFITFEIYKMKGIFAWVVYCLIPSISLWLLKSNNIDVKDIGVLKKWDYNNITRFVRVIL